MAGVQFGFATEVTKTVFIYSTMKWPDFVQLPGCEIVQAPSVVSGGAFFKSHGRIKRLQAAACKSVYTGNAPICSSLRAREPKGSELQLKREPFDPVCPLWLDRVFYCCHDIRCHTTVDAF